MCAYIPSLLLALRSHMGEQTTSGNSIILKYVSGYVTKFSMTCASMDNTNFIPTGLQAATRIMSSVRVCEPEMILSLSSIKQMYCVLMFPD